MRSSSISHRTCRLAPIICSAPCGYTLNNLRKIMKEETRKTIEEPPRKPIPIFSQARTAMATPSMMFIISNVKSS